MEKKYLKEMKEKRCFLNNVLKRFDKRDKEKSAKQWREKFLCWKNLATRTQSRSSGKFYQHIQKITNTSTPSSFHQHKQSERLEKALSLHQSALERWMNSCVLFAEIYLSFSMLHFSRVALIDCNCHFFRSLTVRKGFRSLSLSSSSGVGKEITKKNVNVLENLKNDFFK